MEIKLDCQVEDETTDRSDERKRTPPYLGEDTSPSEHFFRLDQSLGRNQFITQMTGKNRHQLPQLIYRVPYQRTIVLENYLLKMGLV